MQNPELAGVANATFTFARLKETNGSFALEPLSPFWDTPEWKVGWSARMAQRQIKSSPGTAYPWRKELQDRTQIPIKRKIP